MATRKFSLEEARALGRKIGIDFNVIDLDQFRMGLSVELEHGAIDRETDVTGGDPVATGKIAWAHLKEIPDYYTRLARMHADATETD